MRPRSVLLAAVLIGSFMMLSPAVADAQRGGGGRGSGGVAVRPPGGGAAVRPPAGGGAARPPGGGAAVRPPAGRPQPGRPVVRPGAYGSGMYRGSPYYGYGYRYGYGRLTWGSSGWWYPFGYGPYWYGPYWYGAYGYGSYGYGAYGYGAYGYQWGDEQGGSLKLEVKPNNADVFVDGYFAGIVDDFDGFFQSLDVAPGSHSITLWCQGYGTVTQQVYAQPGNPLKLRYQMVPLAAGEPQDPRPMPPPVAQAPRDRRDWPPPPDQPGPPDRPARPPRSAPRPQPAEPLQPVFPTAVGETPNYAQLVIKVQPAGAQIFIDGEAWQGSPGADRLVVHLPVGVHHVEIRKDGFRTFRTDVQIRTGEPTTLNVSLSGQGGQ